MNKQCILGSQDGLKSKTALCKSCSEFIFIQSGTYLTNLIGLQSKILVNKSGIASILAENAYL